MYEEEFSKRLCQLRMQREVSARDMSLSIGQNPGYINNIESGKNLPSMSSFFFICEYLNITPQEFFDIKSTNPEKLNHLVQELKGLDSDMLSHITAIVKGLRR